MTIAVGLLTNEGIVVAADTEESSDYWKIEQSKIWFGFSRRMSERRVSCTVCGAGYPAGMTRSLMQHIVDAVVDAPMDDLKDDVKLRAVIEARATEFHAKHVVPVAHVANPPVLQTLVATQTDGAFRIWTTDAGSAAQEQGFAAIGMGNAHASSFLVRHYRGPRYTSHHDGILLAAAAVHQAKEFVTRCGKYTEVALVRRGEPARVKPSTVKRMDDLFSQMLYDVEPDVWRQALGAEPNTRDARMDLPAARTEFAKVRNLIDIPPDAR